MTAGGGKLKVLVTFAALSFFAASGLPTFVMEAVQAYHVSHSAAGSLESYTTLTQVVASFVMFSLLLKLGFRRSMVAAFSLLVLASFVLPWLDNIWAIRLYLIVSGLTFVAIKIVCYSSVALVVKDEKEHASFINLMEACFTAGVIAGMWLFSVFVGFFSLHWMRVLWVFAALGVPLVVWWWLGPFDERAIRREEEKPVVSIFGDARHLLHAGTVLFVVLVFAYESLEQGIGSWLPTFNSEILRLPDALAIQMASLFTAGIVTGRFLGAWVLRRVSWHRFFLVNFVLGLALLVVVLAHIRPGLGAHSDSIFNVPPVAFGIPLLGVLIGPVYPTLISSILESHPRPLHAIVMSMAMLVTPFSDSISSKILGLMFGAWGGVTAFAYASLVPLTILLLLIYPFQWARLKLMAGLEATKS